MVSFRRIVPILAVAAAVPLLAGCGGGGKKAESTTAPAPATTTSPAPKPATRPALDPSKTYTVTLKTNKGTFAFELDVKDSPHTTASFSALVKGGFFDGLKFHRIVPGFVIQGGDPNGDGTGGPGYTVVDPPPSNTQYTKGVVAMAKTGTDPPGTSGSQFFVVTGDNIGLPPEYAVLGKVTSGLAVVDKIGQLGDPSTEQPTTPVVIQKATIATS